ncbi:hypothetical protein ACWGJ2_33425 [Streptomyces sp. NPDC054796]
MFTTRIAFAVVALAAVAALSGVGVAAAAPVSGHTVPVDSPGFLSGNA